MNLFANAALFVTAMPIPAMKMISAYNNFADQHFMLLCCAAAAVGAIVYLFVTGAAGNLKGIGTQRRKLRERRRRTKADLRAESGGAARMDVPRGDVKRRPLPLPRPASKPR